MLHLFDIVYHPASLETDSESLFTLHGTAAGCRFVKTNKRGRAPHFLNAGRGFSVLFCRRAGAQ
ncbi:MAG: hypothetical protein DBY17_03405 [Oscillospiraceae bacterium]|nr:MAG: hypothetical protein DBY17_03405 [Oscillospiraceae bacterium]